MANGPDVKPSVRSYVHVAEVNTTAGIRLTTRVQGTGGPKFVGKCKEIVGACKEHGVRVFDTGDTYKTEAELAEALQEYPDAIVLEKIKPSSLAKQSFDNIVSEMLSKFHRKSLDFLLMHWPFSERRRTLNLWRQMIRAKEDGRVRAVGLSNCDVATIEYLQAETGVLPDLIEIHFNPQVFQPDIVRWCHERGVVVLGFSLFSGSSWGSGTLLKHPTIGKIASDLSKTPAQVLVSWCLAQGVIPITASTSGQRVKEVAAVDFELGPAHLKALVDMRAHSTTTSVQAAVFGPVLSLAPPLALAAVLRNIAAMLAAALLRRAALLLLWALNTALCLLSAALNLPARLMFRPAPLSGEEQRCLASLQDHGYAVTTVEALTGSDIVDYAALVKTHESEEKAVFPGSVFRWMSWLPVELDAGTRAAVGATIGAEVRRVVRAYYRMAVALNFSFIKYTKAGSTPDDDAGWHSDHEDLSCIKVFLYLTDVMVEGSCPFTLVRGSHLGSARFLRAREYTAFPFKSVNSKAKLHDPDILRTFNPSDVVNCYGRAGTLVLVDVSTLHKIHIPTGGCTEPRCVVMSCLTKQATLGVPNMHARTAAVNPWIPDDLKPPLSAITIPINKNDTGWGLTALSHFLVRLPVLLSVLNMPVMKAKKKHLEDQAKLSKKDS